MFEESGLPETGCDKLEKSCHSEDVYALKMGKIAGSSIEEQGLELRIRIDLP